MSQLKHVKESIKEAVRRHPLPVALAVFTVALLAFYSNSFTADWHYDDFHHVKENINIRKISNVPLFFTDPSTFSRNPNTKMYRPLLMATHALNYWIALQYTRDGYHVVGYHVVNFLLHLATVLGVFLLAYHLFRWKTPLAGLNPFLPALFAGLLFGLHTINTETVVYISSRSAGMSTMFVAFGFYAYLRAARGAGTALLPLLLAAVCYALGLFCKEIAVTLPAMLLFYEVLLDREWWKGLSPVRVASVLALRLAPFAAVALGYLGIRHTVLREGSLLNQITFVGGTAAAPTFTSQMATQAKVWVYYIREMLWPTSLSLDKPFEVSVGFTETVVILCLVLLAALFAAAVAAWRKYPLITFGTLWFFTALLPETLFRLNIVLNDHRLYLPAVGATLLFTFVAARLYVRFRAEGGTRFTLFLSIIGLVLLCMGLGTFKRNMAFATEETIWKDTILKDKNSVRGYNNLGIYYEQSGQLDLAVRYYSKTASLAPMFPNAYINLGNVYHKKREFEKAEKFMRRAIDLEPDSALAWYNLGNIYREWGKDGQAVEAYRNSLTYNPRYIEAANNLANIFFKNAGYGEAVAYYRKALDIDPTFAMSYYNMGLAFEAMGKVREAIETFTLFNRYWDGDPRYLDIANRKIETLKSVSPGSRPPPPRPTR